MPLFYQQHINQHTRFAIWKIVEDEAFFREKVEPHKHFTNKEKLIQHLAAKHLLIVLEKEFPVNKIQVAENGKPFLPDAEFNFSLSHTKDYAAAIISTEQKAAVDIEQLNEKALRLMDKFLNSIEKDQVHILMQKDEHKYLPTLLWSCKETLFKYYEKGNVDFKSMLHIDIATCYSEKFKAAIKTENAEENIEVNYKYFDEICLSYIAK